MLSIARLFLALNFDRTIIAPLWKHKGFEECP